ncbi:uncharacterized protein TRUGW13939_11609 [Talaromyces rugulosus]|uniref:Uncharacterized protein n=1 Tax=Talaromyces rugulosus TaxID=121627 RepID=A0A7H8RFS8_TALRU|nr:uncharacterized protein TRUGW13939_11609 [Talaromyces rugulosus]QKX64435.1 hypothetical protein TRUGW13939_11609 [Talaromyces rugulosus]
MAGSSQTKMMLQTGCCRQRQALERRPREKQGRRHEGARWRRERRGKDKDGDEGEDGDKDGDGDGERDERRPSNVKSGAAL